MIKFSEIRIQKIPFIDDSFERRVSQHYVVKEGLLASTIIPRQYDGRTMSVSYTVKVINDEDLVKSFEQVVEKKLLVPSKSRVYYTEYDWRHDTSPKDYYTLLEMPEGLVGKIVRITPLR